MIWDREADMFNAEINKKICCISCICTTHKYESITQDSDLFQVHQQSVAAALPLRPQDALHQPRGRLPHRTLHHHAARAQSQVVQWSRSRSYCIFSRSVR